MPNNESLNQYRPLDSCMLIDSKLSTRTELLEYIFSTELFERLIEPKNLRAAYTIASQENVDTCIFGPSVTIDNIRSFLADLDSSDHKSDCAYIATYREGERKEIKGIHAQVEFPCTKQKFNSTIITALKNANGGSLPISKRKNPITGELLDLEKSIKRLEVEEEGTQAGPVFLEHAAVLAKALAEIEPHNLKFRPDGSPTQLTSEAIESLVDNLFANAAPGRDLSSFKIALKNYLFEWIEEACKNGKKAANLKLKKDILAYFRLNT